MPLVSMGTAWYFPFCQCPLTTVQCSVPTVAPLRLLLPWPAREEIATPATSPRRWLRPWPYIEPYQVVPLLLLSPGRDLSPSDLDRSVTPSTETVTAAPNQMLRKANPALVMIARQGRQQNGDYGVQGSSPLAGGPDLLSAAGDKPMQSCKQMPFVHSRGGLKDSSQLALTPPPSVTKS